jgi:hypothetical protein
MNNFIFSLRMFYLSKDKAIFHYLTHELHLRLIASWSARKFQQLDYLVGK